MIKNPFGGRNAARHRCVLRLASVRARDPDLDRRALCDARVRRGLKHPLARENGVAL